MSAQNITLLMSLLLLGAGSLAGCRDSAQENPAAQPPAPQPAAGPPAATHSAARPLTAAFAGEYRWGAAAAEEPGGILTVYPESDSTILFQLDANDGAPAYHLVNVLGRARLRGNTARYFAKAPEDAHGCQLTIFFAADSALVASVPGYTEDCLFGGNLTADGGYRRVSRQVPDYVIGGEGDTLRFAQLPPDRLRDMQ